MSRSLRSLGIFPVIFLLFFIGVLSGGIFIAPASADEMETNLDGPRSDREDTAVSVKSVPADQEPAVSWWQSAIQGISSFFRSLFGGENSTIQKGSVTSTVGLTVRSGAGSFNREVGSLPYGTEVTIIGERSGWYKIEYQDRKAWISSRYVSVAGSAQKPKTVKLPREALPPSTIAGYVSAPGGLNVRSGPGTSNNRIHVLKPRDSVHIHDEKDGWYKVTVGGYTGWVSAKYITLGKAPAKKNAPPKKQPLKVSLNVPQRTQFDPVNGKYQSSWCGPTSLAMLYEYYGRKEKTWDVAKRTYDFKRRQGTDAAKIVADAKAHGFPNTKLVTGVDFNFLEQKLKEGKPVMVGVEVAWQSGHYMVVVGLEGDKVIVNDPGRKGVRRTFSRSWFLRQWEGRWRRSIVLEK